MMNHSGNSASHPVLRLPTGDSCHVPSSGSQPLSGPQTSFLPYPNLPQSYLPFPSICMSPYLPSYMTTFPQSPLPTATSGLQFPCTVSSLVPSDLQAFRQKPFDDPSPQTCVQPGTGASGTVDHSRTLPTGSASPCPLPGAGTKGGVAAAKPLDGQPSEMGPAPEEQKKAPGANAYMRRNVYKSIVQHLFTYIRKNKGEIVKVLLSSNFTMRDIEHAFFNVGTYNYRLQGKTNKRSAQEIISALISGRNVYTIMLRESLNAMLRNLDSGRCGKITRENTSTYRDTCVKYYNETVRALGGEAQGKSFVL